MPYCLITHLTVSITRLFRGADLGPRILVDAPPPVSFVGPAIEIEREEVGRRMIDVVVADLGRAGQTRVNVVPRGMQDHIKRGMRLRLLRMEHQEGVSLRRSVAPFLPAPMLERIQLSPREFRLLLLCRRPTRLLCARPSLPPAKQTPGRESLSSCCSPLSERSYTSLITPVLDPNERASMPI